MAQATYDSSFELAFVPMPGSGAALPDLVAPPPLALPILDLASTDPLPEFGASPPAAPLEPVPSPSLAALSSGAVRLDARSPGSLWLQGEVLMCACPDCAAPMSVRLWLMIADCWKCGTSIELSEEQERQARRLLAERDEALRSREGAVSEVRPLRAAAAAHAATGSNGGAVLRETAQPVPHRPLPREDRLEPAARHPDAPRRRAKITRPDGRRPAAQRHVGVRAKIRKMAVIGSVRLWVHDFFRNMPAWFASLVFNIVLLIVLSLIPISSRESGTEFLLLTEVDPKPRVGGDPAAVFVKDNVKFDLPPPSNDWLEDDTRREVLIRADQEAKALRLDPDAPVYDLPPLDKVQQLVRSKDAVKRTFAGRDPRMRVEMVTAEGGTTLTEAAVARALRWLALQQKKDGGWSISGGESDAAGTSLALLPFLGAGQTHQVGIYKDNVSLGLRWLIQHQGADGDLRHTLKNDNAGMYAHGQGAIVLCEAYALTGDEQFRRPAQKAVDFIVRAQHEGGGWRYQPGQAGDTSVLGWQLMALYSARAAKLNVPESTMELAGQFLDSVQDQGGALYSYTRGPAPSPPMTAEGLLCRMYTGWTKKNPALANGLDYLMTHHMPHIDRPDIYYWYYGTQVAHHMGGQQWNRWNMTMRDVLVNTQEDAGPHAGSWAPRGPHAERGGRIYMTSLATCSLEVYYRHVPLFKQIDLEGELARP